MSNIQRPLGPVGVFEVAVFVIKAGLKCPAAAPMPRPLCTAPVSHANDHIFSYTIKRAGHDSGAYATRKGTGRGADRHMGGQTKRKQS